MKKAALAFIVLLTFALTAASQQTCKRHTEPEGGFSLCPPEGWSIEEKTGQKYKVVFGTPSNNFTPNINLKEEAYDGPLNEYLAAGIKSILASTEKLGATSIELTGQSDFVTDSGQRGFRVGYRTKYKGYLIRTIQYLLNGKSGKKIVVSCTALESDREVLDDVFDRSVKTFRFD